MLSKKENKLLIEILSMGVCLGKKKYVYKNRNRAINIETLSIRGF
jgi:hypothetical protein